MMLSRPLPILLIFGLLVRIAILLGSPDALRGDPDGYRDLAENMLACGTFGHGAVTSAYRPPLYPLLLVPCVVLGAGATVAIGALHVVLGVATVGLTFLLARRAGLGQGPAAIAAVLVAVDPILLTQSALVMSETPAALLVVLAVLCLDRCARPAAPGGAVLAGGVLGVLALCRPGLLAFAGLAAVAVLQRGGMGRIGRRRTGGDTPVASGKGEHGTGQQSRSGAWLVSAGIVLGVLAVVGPWMLRNQIAIGQAKAATTHGGYTLLLGNNGMFYDHLRCGPWFEAWHAESFHAWWQGELQAADLIESEALPERLLFRSPRAELQADVLAYHRAIAAIRSEPRMFLWSCVVRVGHFWSPLPFRLSPDESRSRWVARVAVAAWYIVEFVLAAIGLGVAFVRPRGARSILAWSMLLALSLTAVHTIYWSNLRMRAPIMPLVAIAAAAGADAIMRRVKS